MIGPKLLRVLQEGEFQRVGGEDTRHVTVRVLSATNQDLAALEELERNLAGPDRERVLRLIGERAGHASAPPARRHAQSQFGTPGRQASSSLAPR